MAAEILSKCHNALVAEINPRPQVGHQYECKVCGNPCDLQETMPAEEEKKPEVETTSVPVETTEKTEPVADEE